MGINNETKKDLGGGIKELKDLGFFEENGVILTYEKINTLFQTREWLKTYLQEIQNDLEDVKKVQELLTPLKSDIDFMIGRANEQGKIIKKGLEILQKNSAQNRSLDSSETISSFRTKEEKEIQLKRDESVFNKKFGRLRGIFFKITTLFDYIVVINKNWQDLTSPQIKRNIGEGVQPAVLLYDYLVQEICNFYDHIKESKSLIKGIKKELKENSTDSWSLIKKIKKDVYEREKDQYVKLVEKIRENPYIDFPELPSYLNKIYTFRNAVPVHFDKDERLIKSEEDYRKMYKIFDEVGIGKMLIDFGLYFEECRKRFQGLL